LKLTTDRHEASRGLFATAELLVTILVKGMNLQHFGTNLVDIHMQIRINPEIWIQI